jgi:hypothetical protein
MNSEASRRTFLDLFLQDVVAREEFKSQLKVFCELSLTTSAKLFGNKRVRLTGKIDCAIANCGGKPWSTETTPLPESNIIAVEAKKSSEDMNTLQCIAEAAALHNARKEAGKVNCNVWEIFTNAAFWKFIYVDNNSKVWKSNVYRVSLEHYDHDNVVKVYRFLHYIVKASYESWKGPD